MGQILDDLTKEIENYGKDYVTIKIVDVNYPGDELEKNETGTFDVQVFNSGPLRMNDVTVKVEGLDGVLVKNVGANDPYVGSFTTLPGAFAQIPAHAPEGTPDAGRSLLGTLGFKAPNRTLSERILIRVSLDQWDPDVFTHMLESHSDPDASVNDTFVSSIEST